MALPRLLLGVLAALGAGAAVAPAAAQAVIPWAACAPTGYECARLDVPLDPSGRQAGTVSLNLTRIPAASNPSRVALVALAGGPGQAAVPLAQAFARDLGPALASRDLLVLDQRGTGGSAALRCTARSRDGVVAQARRCSSQLGPRRAFFRTAESVADLERLRVEGGYEKLALHGVSYGTKVALAYAAAYPDRTESLLLDSVVLPEGPDAFRRATLRAVPRVLREACAGGLCSGITRSAATDLRTLASRLRKRSLRGTVVATTGGRFRATLDEPGLLAILLAGDLNPALRAELPGSVRAALAGDAQPVLRLRARAVGLDLRRGTVPRTVGLQSARADSDALFLATTCEENPTFPWSRAASERRRLSQAITAARRLPAAALGPFGRGTALQLGYLPLCLGWRNAAPAPAAPGALPAVPTLLLEGRGDLRTPVEDATRLAARIPGAQVLGVPNVGHSVLGSDASGCASAAVAAFYGGTPVAACAPTPPRFAPTPRPPTDAARLQPYGDIPGKVGRTVEALRITVNDAQSQILGAAIALGRAPLGAGGLRAGSVRVAPDGLALIDYEYVPGVRISGRLPRDGDAVFSVSGRAAASGTVRVAPDLTVTGRLGGRDVATRFGGRAAAAADRPFGGLTLAQAIARGKRIRERVG